MFEAAPLHNGAKFERVRVKQRDTWSLCVSSCAQSQDPPPPGSRCSEGESCDFAQDDRLMHFRGRAVARRCQVRAGARQTARHVVPVCVSSCAQSQDPPPPGSRCSEGGSCDFAQDDRLMHFRGRAAARRCQVQAGARQTARHVVPVCVILRAVAGSTPAGQPLQRRWILRLRAG